MKISLNWLKDFVEFDKKLSIKDIAWRLTEATAEIEKTHVLGKGLENVVVGELIKSEKHPDADTLSVGQVRVSPKETIQVIYGQKAVINVGDRVPVAVAPCELPGGKIERKPLRGVMSEGMLCLDSELFKGAAEKLTKFSKSAALGSKVIDVLGMNDVVFEIDNHSITHRPDLFSHLGFARESVALGIAKWKKIAKKKIKKMPMNKKSPVKVAFANKAISKNYFGTVVTHLSTKESPAWMKARLNAVGIRSINAIVDITNYVMMELGQPTHAFDLRILEGKTFTNRLSKKGEKITTLDGVTRELPEGIIVGETERGIVDLAGIMGAQNSEIQPDTSSIYFHSSQFNNVMIRKAMINLGHRTDGGTMHEKNIEAERSEAGFKRGLELFAEIFPEARFDYQAIHIQQDKTEKVRVRLLLKKFVSHIGIEIPAKKSKQILEDLGFKVTVKKDLFEVEVPSWRANGVTIPEDVIEEIVRINGYSNVPAQPPTVELVTPHKIHKRHVKRIAQQFLAGQGFQEEVNFSFLSEQHLRNISIAVGTDIIEVKNPVSDDFRFMRPNFLSYLLSNLARNQVMSQQVWKTFEMGAVYTRSDDEVIEQHRLSFLLASEQQSFYQAKGVAEGLFRELSLAVELKQTEHRYAYPGRSLNLVVAEKAIGHIYDLHPLLKEQFGLKGSVAIVDINLDELYKLKPQEVFYKTLNRNPQALLDISVVVDHKTIMSEIENLIRTVETNYLKRAELVDVYEGKNLGEGKKSLTFALAYQHPDRTLDEKEIQSILDALIKKIESSGGVVRR